MTNKKEMGIYRKFDVRRTDGKDGFGDKHFNCDYYVMDITHDKHAIPALKVYADSCRDEYPVLANDLDAKIQAVEFKEMERSNTALKKRLEEALVCLKALTEICACKDNYLCAAHRKAFELLEAWKAEANA